MSKTGIELISEERIKQIEKHGYTPEHDSFYTDELYRAAMAYLASAHHRTRESGLVFWPFNEKFFHGGTNFVEDLTKAGAFIAAELDRLQLINEGND